MFKKYIKFTKVWVAACAFCSINLSATGIQENAKTEAVKEQQSQENLNLKKQQILKRTDEVKQEILNNFNKYDKKDFQVEGFTNKIYYKKGLPILVYEHDKTKAKILFQIFNKEIVKGCADSYFLRAFEANDKGIAHICEHCLGDLSQIEKFEHQNPNLNIGYDTYKDGIMISISSEMSTKVLLTQILNWLRNPEAINNKEKFEVEKNRVINELINKNEYLSLFKDMEFYSATGVPKEVKTVKHEEFKKFFNEYIHPSNLLVTRYISDAEPAKIKEYLNLLNELYLKHFNYKENNVKYSLKDATVYHKKEDKISQEDWKFLEKQGKEKFTITARFNLDRLNLNAKHKDALSLTLKDKRKREELKEYVKTMGYRLRGDFVIDNYLQNFVIFLTTNDAELCTEEVIKQNLKKILHFLKNQLKSLTDEEIVKNSVFIHSFDENGVNLKPEKYILNSLLKYKRTHDFSYFVRDSFSNYNEIFSDNIFNVDQNNEILEDENSILKNIKENLNVFDVLAEKGPTRIDVEDVVLITEKERKELNKKENFRTVFFLPIELKDYDHDRELFAVSAKFLKEYLIDLLGYKKGLIYDLLFYPEVEKSDIAGYFYENIFAEKDVIDYIYNNFEKIIEDFKLTQEEFEIHKKEFKELIVKNILDELDSFKKRGEEINETFETYLNGKGSDELKKYYNLGILKKMINFFNSYNSSKYLLLKDLKFLKKIRDGANEFDNKYSGINMEITKEMMKDYKEMFLDGFIELVKYSYDAYNKIYYNIDRIKFDDVTKTIKSASLMKRNKLEKLNKQLKAAFDFDAK